MWRLKPSFKKTATACICFLLLFGTIKAFAAPSATVNVLAEFGKSTLTNNTYLTVNLNNSYTSLIVVASPRYNVNSEGARTVRVRNKTATSFEIKVDNDAGTFTGSTIVDWIAFEAGAYNLDTGGGTTNVIAGTVNVSNVSCNGNFFAGGTTVNFAPVFTGVPSVLHTVTSDTDTSWVFSSVHDGVNRANPATASTAVLTLQRSFASCTHGAEDIDYVAFDAVHGTNNSNALEAQLSPNTVNCCSATGTVVNFNTAFSSAPEVIINAQNGENGGNGGFSLLHTGTAITTASFAASIDEEGPAADRTHTTEEVSILAFEPNGGELAEITSSPWDQDAGLQLWIRANSLGLVDGDPVSTWTDTSINSNDLIQAGGLRPAFRNNATDNINFNPVIDFDGVDDFVEDADGELYLNTQNSASMFVVIQSDSATADVGFFRTENTASTDNGLSMRYDLAGFIGGGTNLIKFGDGTNPVVNGESSSNTQTTEPQILDLFRDNGTAPRLFINGLQNTLANSPANSGAMGGLDYVRVGDHGTGVWDGSVAEILLYTEALNATDRQVVESYLAVKYGMTLDQSGTGTNYLSSTSTIIFDADTAGAGTGFMNSFNNDIFGIGQDDNSSLDQTSSKSVNSDAIITLSNASSQDDGDFLLIGNDNDDNGTIEEITTELPTTSTSRLDREWRVDTTGNIGTVTLSFDLNGIAVSGTTAGDFKLIVDSVDSDFSNGISRGFNATSFAGNILTFDNVTLNNSDTFTISTGDQGPGGIPGIELWYRASDLALSDGASVSNWDDFGLNDYDAVQPVGGEQATFRNNTTDNINFNPVIEYDGTNDVFAIEDLSYTGTAALSQIYTCAVFRTSSSSAAFNGNWAFLDWDRSEYFDFYIRDDNGGIDFSYAAGGINDNSSTVTGFNDGQPHLACAFYDGTLTTDTVISADGLDVFSSDEEPTNQTIGTANTRFGFVGDGSEASTFNGTQNNLFYNGDMAEILYYADESISAAQRDRVESYLAVKYGITLDQSGTGHNYFDSSGNIIFDADTAGAGTGFVNAYANDVAGIGQDDTSALDQTQSRSINSDSIVTMSGASSQDDGDFLVWGNDNDDDGTIEKLFTEVPAGFTYRLDREWRIDETGDMGTVTVAVDLTGLNVTVVSASDISLVTDTDSDFSNGTSQTINAASFASNIATFNLVNFADMDHFTIAVVAPLAPGGVTNNLDLWLRANAGTSTTTNGQPVTSWADQSGNGNNASSATGPNYQGDVFNSNPILRFNNNAAEAMTSTFARGNDEDLFVVASNADSTENTIVDDATTKGERRILVDLGSSDNNTTGFVNGTEVATASPNEPNDTPVLSLLRIRSGDTEQLYVNHDLEGSLETGAPAAATALLIGDSPVSSSPHAGDIAEVVSYSGTLNATDQLRVESYLAVKYGLTLDQSGTGTNYLDSSSNIIFDADTGGAGSGFMNGFANDIAGIGVDGGSGLDQPSSRSVNADAIVTMSNASSLGELDFLIWGNDNDDNGTIEEISTELPPEFLNRLDREWRVDEANDVGTVTVAFDLSSITQSGTQASDFRLLIDSTDSDFSNGISSSVAASSFASNIVTFNNVTLNNSDTFTLATRTIGPGGVAGVEIWYKVGDLALSDGNGISNLDDASINDFDSSQAVGGEQPTYRDNATDNINFNPVAEYDGANDVLAVEDLSYTGTNALSQIYSCSIFRTSFVDAGTNTNWAFLDWDRSEYFNYYVEGDGGIDFSYNGAAIRDNTSSIAGFNDGVPHMACVFYDGALVNDTIVRVDGQDVFNANVEGTNQTIGTANTRFGFVGDGSEATTFNGTQNNIFYDGDIAETVYFANTSLSTTNDTPRVESYLAVKYGLTLDQSGTGQNYFDSSGAIVFDADTAGAGSGTFNSYANDISGIARDDLGTLSQSQSMSVNSDAIMTVNNASSLDDGDYMIWGNDNDDNGTIELTLTGKPSSLSQILDRKWRMSEIGDVGTVTLTVNLAGLGIAPGTLASEVKLVRDTDADFTNGGTTIVDAQTFIGDVATFTLVDFNHQDFFSFGLATNDNQLFWGMPY